MKIFTFIAICGLVAGQNRRNNNGNTDSPRSGLSGQHRSTGGPRMSPKLARIINSLSTIDEFLSIISRGQKGPNNVFIADRFGGVERSNAIRAKRAVCATELRTVSLDHDNKDSSVRYFPSCTRIYRCGGCCEPLFTCEANETVTRNFEIVVSRLIADDDLIPEEKKIIPLDEDISCVCGCKIKKEDCHPKQKYNEELCECTCTNNDEENKCDLNAKLKYWNPATCSCHCIEEKICNLGSRFNPDSCRCEPQQTSSFFGNERQIDYRYSENSKKRDSLPHIVPPDTDSRRRSNKDDPEYK